MPKKGTRHVRESGNTRSAHHHQQQQQQPPHPAAAATATATPTATPIATTTATATATIPEASTTTTAKHFRSVHIGVTNGKRWLSLKKRLGLTTDEDVAVYLLDLAESAAPNRYVSMVVQRAVVIDLNNNRSARRQRRLVCRRRRRAGSCEHLVGATVAVTRSRDFPPTVTYRTRFVESPSCGGGRGKEDTMCKGSEAEEERRCESRSIPSCRAEGARYCMSR